MALLEGRLLGIVVGLLVGLLGVAFTALRRRRSRRRAAFDVVSTKERGKVAVSRQRYRRGDVICQESPLLSSPPGVTPFMGFARLDAAARARLLSLYAPEVLAENVAVTKTVGERGERLEEALESNGWPPDVAQGSRNFIWKCLRVWEANKLSVAGADGSLTVIFEFISRMNHSCEPNARLLPGSVPGELVVVAAADVEVGEEICICYLEANAMPMLHFMYLPTELRRRQLRRWGFECGCARCMLPEDRARSFRCPADPRCGGEAVVLGEGALGACGACGRAAPGGSRLLQDEAALVAEAEGALADALRASVVVADFPMGAVVALLDRCAEQGLAARHWLVFWLLSLAAVGSGSGRDLRTAAHGVAHAPALPTTAEAAVRLLAPRAREMLAKAGGLPALSRPGTTPHIAAYFELAA